MQLRIIIINRDVLMQFSENIIIELATLGVCHNQSLSSRKIISIIKNLIPELWSPTAEVVMSTIERCLDTDHLTIDDVTAISPAMMRTTSTGKQRLEDLLLSDPGEGLSPTIFALETMQICLLDLVSANIAESVLARIRERLQSKLSDFHHRSKQCLHVGQYTNLWFLLETRRLESSVHILDLAYGKINRNHILLTNTQRA
jgi:hypothetical protein